MRKTKNTQEHELLLGVKVNLEGFERLAGIQKKLNSGKEGMQNIVEFAATLNALAKTISELSGSGLSYDMQKIVATINKAMSSLDKIDDITMVDKKISSKKYGTGRSLTRTVKVPDETSAAKFSAESGMALANVKRELIDINNVIARNLHLAQQKQAAEALSVKYTKDNNKELVNQEKVTEDIVDNIDKSAKKSLGFWGNLKKATKEFFSMEKIIGRISFVLTAKLSYDVFNTLTRLPGQALTLWRDFQSEMSKTFAQMAGSSKHTMDSMSQDVINLSKKYGIAAKEISTAMYEIISSQVPVKDAAMVMEEAIKLSIAGAGGLEEATKTLVQIANAYNMSFDQVGRISDVAFQSVKYGQLTLQQFTEQMSKVVATAAIFKIPMEEIAAAVSTLTINGINAEQSFTALNQMLMTIANPTERAKELMGQLGLNLSVGDVQAKGLGGALSELVPILNMTGSANEELLNIMFKSRTGFKAAASLLENMPEYYDNYIRMIDSAGASEEALAMRTNDVNFQMNKFKTTWEALLIKLTSGKNEQISGFFREMTSLIDGLSKNLDLVFATLRGIMILIGGVVLNKLLTTLGTIYNFIKTMPAQLKMLSVAMNTVGASAKVMLASFTAGLSLVITLLAELINGVVTYSKRLGEKRLREAFGIDELSADIKRIDGDIKKFDSTLSKLNGVKQLASQWENLNKIQSRNKTQNESMAKLYSSIEKVMDGVGIKIDDTGTKTERLAKYLLLVDQRLTEISQKRLLADAAKLSSETKMGMIDFATKPGKLRFDYTKSGRIKLGENVNYVNQVYTNTITELQKLIRSGDIGKISSRASDLESYAASQRKKFADELEYYSKYNKDEKALEFATKGIDAADSIIQYALSLQNMGVQSIKTSIPEYKDQVNTGGNQPSQVSFLSDAQGIVSSLFGDRIFETVAELQAEMKKKVDEINKKIADAQAKGTTVLDLKKTKDELEKFTDVVNSGTFIQVFESGQTAINKLMENAKLLKQSGNDAASKAEFDRAMNVYGNFSNTISGWATAEMANMTPAEQKVFRDNTATSMAQMLFNIVNQAKDALSDKDFLAFAVKQYGMSDALTMDFDALNKAIDDAADQPAKAEIYNIIKTNMLTEYEKILKDLFGIVEQPEFIKTMIENIKQAASEQGITDVAGLEGLIDTGIKAAEYSGMTITGDNKSAIRSAILPKTEDAGFNWKSMVGIKEYKDGNDALLDIGQQTVSQLQDVWSFYWEWEVRKLQEQHNKKLELMENEKSIMLANENMSAQQKEIIEKRFEERKRQMQEKLDKEMAAKKKKQAIFNASIDFARGLIGIWASELSKGILGVATAPVLTGLLSGIFAAQIAMINQQKFAGGGYTGSGIGSKDETGYRPAGIVHEGELVIDKKTLDKNFMPMMSLYEAMKSGKSFGDAVSGYMLGNSRARIIRPNSSGSFATGGLVGRNNTSTNTKIIVDLKGIRTIDDVELNQRVESGGLKRRKIG